jgi:hypothetical protein
MLQLEVAVPKGYDRTAFATLAEDSKTLATGLAAAAATPELAARLGNPDCNPLRPGGHPPFGSYLLRHHASAPDECVREYGGHVLVFEPLEGPALDAESFGRFALLAYAGPLGGDGRLRRSQGGLRLAQAMLAAVMARLAPGTELELHLAPQRPWWALWQSRPRQGHPLSTDLPRCRPPCLDEAILTLRLLRSIEPRLYRRPATDAESRWDAGGAIAEHRIGESGGSNGSGDGRGE